jgi:hypothetical protein
LPVADLIRRDSDLSRSDGDDRLDAVPLASADQQPLMGFTFARNANHLIENSGESSKSSRQLQCEATKPIENFPNAPRLRCCRKLSTNHDKFWFGFLSQLPG